MTRAKSLLFAACLFCIFAAASSAYSVLTHEQLIDLTWKDLLQPLLLKRFPATTAAGLQRAHSFAYGGSAVQDLGYYPFANEFFSNLTHYVRSGDFITNLLRDARTVDEYAFALGALSHYVGDNVGHHDAVNPATAIAFPKLARKFGPVVTYDEAPHAHVRAEFAFDIDQLSKTRLAPGAYLRFIGLRVPQRLLAQAFTETYSLPLRGLLGPGGPAIRSYRTSVRTFLPRVAYAETIIHRNDFLPDTPGEPLEIYLNHIAQADFQTVWSRYRRKPRLTTRLLALLIRVLPKVGVLSDLAIKIPTAATDELYVKSVNRAIEVYSAWLKQFASLPQPSSLQTSPAIPNRDLDTGDKVQPGGYALTDQTYARLLHTITANQPPFVEPGLKRDILDYYSDPNAPISTKSNSQAWAQVTRDLALLLRIPAAVAPTPSL